MYPAPKPYDDSGYSRFMAYSFAGRGGLAILLIFLALKNGDFAYQLMGLFAVPLVFFALRLGMSNWLHEWRQSKRAAFSLGCSVLFSFTILGLFYYALVVFLNYQ